MTIAELWARVVALSDEHKWLTSAAHAVEGVLIHHLPVWLICSMVMPSHTAHIVGAVSSIQHFYGREKRDNERKKKIPNAEPWRGWFPWQWSWNTQIDLYYPTAASLLIVVLAHL